MKRVELIRNHLKHSTNNLSYQNPLDKFKTNSTILKQELEAFYYPMQGHKEFRDVVFTIMKNLPEFRIQTYQTEMTSSQMKKLSVTQLKLLVKEISKIIPFVQLREDPIKFGIFMECINHYDFGLAVRFSFHFMLYYNSLLILGTDIHKEFIDRCISLDDLGCFGLTELGHGSNVKSILTEAHYDEKTKEFVLNSPSYHAYKWWIGGAGRTANKAIIFAQLYTKEKCHGVHAFIVGIRDKADHMPYPGVIIGDTGPKVGHESVDNGFIGFVNYRVPRQALLNRLSQVSEDGTFFSEIKNADVRFANVLGALSEGRLGLSLATQILLTNGLTISGRYAYLRTQFSKDQEGKGEEQPIINYPTTQIRIFPALAESFALRFAGIKLGLRAINISKFLSEPKNPEEIETHALITALKAYSSSLVQHRLQQFREVMGGSGYSRFNLIGNIRNTNDINTTWEGDNTVLNQQTAKFILDNFKNKMKGKNPSEIYPTLKFLDLFENINDEKVDLSSSEDFDDFNKLKTILDHRVNLMIKFSVGKLAQRIEENKDGLLCAWNNSQVFYIQNMVKAYIENYVFDSFRNKVEEMINSTTKTVLKNLLKLYSLIIFENDLGTLRHDDFISSDACNLIKDEILNLCEKLKNEFIPILDVISAPDEILNAPMGRSDGKIWESYLNRVFSFNKAFEREDWWENLHHK